MRQFKTKTGLLTSYALACGYMEVFSINNKRITLYKEHCVFHVKNTSNESRYWNTFDSLIEARKDFKSQILKEKGDLK